MHSLIPVPQPKRQNLFHHKQQLLPYCRISGAPAAPSNVFTRLPRELQSTIFNLLIGDAVGKLSVEEIFPPSFRLSPLNYKGVRDGIGRKVSLRYNLPGSASPQILLVSYALYQTAHPFYRAICHSVVEASWRDLHRLPDLMPGFSAAGVRTAYLKICDQDFDKWSDVQYFKSKTNAFPNLESLTIVYTDSYQFKNSCYEFAQGRYIRPHDHRYRQQKISASSYADKFCTWQDAILEPPEYLGSRGRQSGTRDFRRHVATGRKVNIEARISVLDGTELKEVRIIVSY